MRGSGRTHGPGRTRRGARALRRVAWVAPLVVVLSCADMPTAPRALVPVSGQILDRDGAPLAQATLVFQSPDSLAGSSSLGTYATTDPSGRYQIDLPAARYRVRLYPRHGSGYPDELRLPEITIGPPTSVFDYRLQGVRVSGQITGPGGSPLTHVDVSAYTLDFSTGVSVYEAAASYSLLLQPGTAYRLEAYPAYDSGLPRIAFDVPPLAADTTIDLNLSGYAVDVKLTLSGTTPLSGAYVEADGSGYASASRRTDVNGLARLYLPAGWYAFRARPNEGYIVEFDDLALNIQADGTAVMDLPGVEWTGTLRRRSDGAPLPDEQLRLASVSQRQTASMTTDVNGAFRFIVYPGRPYSIGRYRIQADVFEFQLLSEGTVSAADSTFDLYVDDPAP